MFSATTVAIGSNTRINYTMGEHVEDENEEDCNKHSFRHLRPQKYGEENLIVYFYVGII